jgi:hypothetical protein
MGASATAYGRGRFPSRVGVGGRYREPENRAAALAGGRYKEPDKKPQQAFRSVKSTAQFAIAGVTRDSAGAVLGDCEVDLFHTASDMLQVRAVSDGAGVFSVLVGNNSDFYYLRAYKTGAPDVAGTSVNTLQATYIGG